MKNKYFVLMSRRKYDEIRKLERTSASQKGFKAGYRAGAESERVKKSKSYSWLKSEIHRKLDVLFPGKEFNKARYKWLKSNTMTTVHISDMTYEELVKTNEHLGDI